ncbi:thymidylate kinase-like [Tropilaelaps mercedesae]|uniref:Thymidylate kinase n=1 Tax=Tropilaelaps mercedesae TaxID=418985 RepID=A0A1V9XDP3_9ACAR|nr:thymidylate kinase-like [Tropilaelaps mercedesae]
MVKPGRKFNAVRVSGAVLVCFVLCQFSSRARPVADDSRTGQQALNLLLVGRKMCSNDVSTRGALIVLEGLDRTGKSTQTMRLVEELEKRGKHAEAWRFPDRSTPLGKVIGEYLQKTKDLDDRAIHLLFSANRWEKRAEMMNKLSQGITLVVDRYAFSGVAFSSAKAGLPLEWCRQPDVGLPKPDLVVFLYADIDVLKTRGGYGLERYENETFQRAVANRYAELQDETWVRIDATAEPEHIAKDILSAVERSTKHLSDDVGKLWSDL